MQPTRRQVIGGAAGLAAGAAGCVDGIGGTSEGEREDVAYTAFFTLEQFADAVAGDALDVENPIPVGELGHHYEVSTQAQLEVARSRAFVYVDLPGFQRWAVDTANNLGENHEEVVLVDATEGVDLRDASHGSGDEGGGHEENGSHDGGDGGHDHGDFDPHFWLDPVRAAACVETIRNGLVEADQKRAEAYESNAERYLDELSALHERFTTQLQERELDTVVVASHDSFGYLADRYDFEVHSPVGVSPNAEPGSTEIRDTIDVVDENEVDVVLYDAFESENLAKTVVADSSAEKTMPLSSLAGTTDEWHENDWGYVEQMLELNLPALKAALKVR
ncbi:zinc ABC transporter substrate-binding protein [Natronomonas salina]|uniref:metal ABC transporter solute-binding protein, Zn/Mn family n=1 Tax=Natronomonas salina TaxID=1710540 RepID=UPI0015B67D93|nr:zinc ABC transporter substrate-binding protein [Natronomonas salina]QLD87692.1 zinc ABC transporter substrate-binding protein [Natronomonas salina]